MSRVIGITVHFEDKTTVKLPADGLVITLGQGGGGSKYTYLNADECPVHGPWRAVPGGTTKDGRPYGPFWGCDQAKGETRCTNKPSKDWVDTHPAERALPKPAADGDFDDLPF